MKFCRSLLLRVAPLLALLSGPASAGRFAVTVEHELPAARPAEVITIPFSEVRRRLPDVRMHHLRVLDARSGAVLPSQVTNFNPDDRAARYDDLVFQYDFAAGERWARFLVETTETPEPPFRRRVFARHVPERLDDFAWENDRMAHRLYGPGLDTPAAGRSRMVSSGIDFWAKRVAYPIVDRWYLKGHDAYHEDTGEGLDLYAVGTSRGVGGSGIWQDGQLLVSDNWAGWRLLANGPLRAVFEINYAPWRAGGKLVRETKRFIVDAGHNLDRIESTFTVEGGGPEELTVALGLGTHPRLRPEIRREAEQGWISDWSVYPTPEEGALGTAIVLEPDRQAAFAADEKNHLILAIVRAGEPLIHYAGGGWTRSGHFSTREEWEAYLTAFAARLRAPVIVTLDPLP